MDMRALPFPNKDVRILMLSLLCDGKEFDF